MEKYDKGEKVGEGTYGVVYRGTLKEQKKIVALKKIHIKSIDQGVSFTALREIKTLQEINHPNIIKLLDVFVHKKNVFLVYEFMDYNLEMVIQDTSNILLSPADIKSYMKMILLGLEHLHKRWILHRDLKPNNLLIGSDGILRIADFGFARTYGSPNAQFTSQVVTIWYRSPELLFGARTYGYAIDIWAVGCIFAELHLRTPYFSGNNELDQLTKIFSALGTPTEQQWPGMKLLSNFVEFNPMPAPPLRELFTAVTDEVLDLLSKFLSFNPNSRPTASEVLNHAYFSKSPSPTDPHKLAKPNLLKKTLPKTTNAMSISPKETKSPLKRPLPVSTTSDLERPIIRRRLDLDTKEE